MGKHALPKFRKTKAAVATGAVVGGIALASAGSAHAATQSQWDAIAQCESGGDWSINYSSDGLSVGGLQFQNASWQDALQYLDQHGYDTSSWTQQLYQGMPSSEVPDEAQEVTAAEALLALQPNPWEASSGCSGVYLQQSDSTFNGGPTPADFIQPGDSAGGSPSSGSGSGSGGTATPPAPTPTPEPSQPPHDPATTGQWRVKAGDCLWNIAKAEYGNGQLYKRIAHANHIHNPRLIQPGWMLDIPSQ